MAMLVSATPLSSGSSSSNRSLPACGSLRSIALASNRYAIARPAGLCHGGFHSSLPRAIGSPITRSPQLDGKPAWRPGKPGLAVRPRPSVAAQSAASPSLQYSSSGGSTGAEQPIGFSGVMKACLDRQYDAEIMKLALPALVAMCLDPIIGAVSAGMIGHLGTQQLGAVSLGILLTSFCTFLFSFLIFLTTPEVAGAVVRKDMDEASRIAARGFWLAGLLGSLTAVSCFFGASSIVQLMRPPEAAVAKYATLYIQIRSFGIFAALVQFVATGTFRGFKDTATPLKAAAISATCSLGLNVLFIHGLKLGVVGAGLATTLAQCISCTFLCSQMLHLKRVRMSDLVKPPSLESLMPMLRAGAVMALRNVISFGMVLYASALCVRAGSIYQAGFEVIRQTWILTIQFFECLNVATQTLCATYLGAGDIPNARSVLFRLAFLGVAIGASVGAVVFFLQMPITNFFTVDPLVVQQVLMTLPMMCALFPADAAASIMDGSLMAAKQTDYLSYSQILGSGLQCVALIMLTDKGAISVLSVWAVLKVLTMVRIGAGVWRNFLSPRYSAYMMPPPAVGDKAGANVVSTADSAAPVAVTDALASSALPGPSEGADAANAYQAASSSPAKEETMMKEAKVEDAATAAAATGAAAVDRSLQDGLAGPMGINGDGLDISSRSAAHLNSTHAHGHAAISHTPLAASSSSSSEESHSTVASAVSDVSSSNRSQELTTVSPDIDSNDNTSSPADGYVSDGEGSSEPYGTAGRGLLLQGGMSAAGVPVPLASSDAFSSFDAVGSPRKSRAERQLEGRGSSTTTSGAISAAHDVVGDSVTSSSGGEEDSASDILHGRGERLFVEKLDDAGTQTGSNGNSSVSNMSDATTSSSPSDQLAVELPRFVARLGGVDGLSEDVRSSEESDSRPVDLSVPVVHSVGSNGVAANNIVELEHSRLHFSSINTNSGNGGGSSKVLVPVGSAHTSSASTMSSREEELSAVASTQAGQGMRSISSLDGSIE